jgi:DnaJ-class molecular chaperone
MCQDCPPSTTTYLPNMEHVTFLGPAASKQPYKCPVCYGEGKVAVLALSMSLPCHACAGSGVVWG